MAASGDDSGVLPIIRDANTFEGLGAILFGGLGGIFLAFANQIIATIRAVFNLFVVPLQTMASVIGQFLIALFGGAADIIGQGAATTIVSIAPTGAFSAGPFTFAEGIGAAALGLFVVAYLISQNITSNVIPGLLVDIPFIGFFAETPEQEEPVEEDEEG